MKPIPVDRESESGQDQSSQSVGDKLSHANKGLGESQVTGDSAGAVEAVLRGVAGVSDDVVVRVLAALAELGVTTVADLEFVSQADLGACGITVIQQRKVHAYYWVVALFVVA